MSVYEREADHLELHGMMHRLTLSTVDERSVVDRDTQVVLLDLQGSSSSALLDWSDIVALNDWTGDLIAQREAQR